MKERRGNNKPQKIILFFIVFVALFNPPVFSNLNLKHILIIGSLLYLLFNIATLSRLIKQFRISITKWWVILITYILIIIGLNSIIYPELWEQQLRSILTTCGFIIYSLIIPLFILTYINKNKITIKELLSIILAASITEAILVLAAIVSPEIKKIFTTTMSNNLKDINGKISEYVLDSSSKRNFGFADSLYDAFGFTSSILYVIALNTAIEQRKFSKWVTVILLIIMTIINSRTGILLFVIGTTLSIIQLATGKNVKNKIIKTIIMTVVIIIASTFMYVFIKNSMPNTYKWISSGYESTVNYINNGEATDYYRQAKDFWILPENIFQLLFGVGAEPKYVINQSSDVGYINEIWKYGLIGLMFEVAIFISLYKQSVYLSNESTKRAILKFCVISFLVYMIKLSPIKDSSGVCLIFIIFFSQIYRNKIEYNAEKLINE